MLALPEKLSAQWIGEQVAPLRAVQVATDHLEVTHPEQPQRVLTLKLPHDDVPAEGEVCWGQFRQTFRMIDGQGRAEELSMWEEEPNSWPVTWEKWVAQWLECMQAGRSQP